MPQLDQFTYFTQFVWLCFFYMTFYVLLFNDGLPKISRILKLRAYLCAQSAEQKPGTEVFSTEAHRLEKASRQDVVLRTLSTSISYLNSSVNGVFQWCLKSVENLNANQLKPMNKRYLRSIGEISLSELVKKNALEASAPLTYRSFSSRPSMSSELSQLWALRVQKCLLSTAARKKKRK